MGKTASIKLSLDAGAFKSGLKDAGKAGEDTAKGIGGAFSKSMSAGIKGGVDSIKGALSTIKSTVLSIGGIAGGIGIAELAHGAMQTQGAFRKLAFDINAGTHAGVQWRTMMQDAQKIALETGQSTDDLGKAMQAVFTETGNAEFTQKAIKDIATAATGAHEPLATIGDIAGTLNKKFGITSEQVGATLATVVGLGNKGGVSVGEMAEKLSIIGANAKEAGLQGQDGFAKIIALMNVADASTGTLKKGITAVGGILETLGTSASRNKVFAQLGVDPSKAKGDVTQQIGAVLAATKGNKDKLAVAFQGESLKVLVDLGKTYAATFESTKGDVRAKTTAATEAYRAALAKAGAAGVTFADLQKEAAAELETGPKKMELALEKLRQAFTKPEVTAALEKLMSALPKLADMIASIVGFASEHPAAAGTLAAVGVGAQGFGGSAISALISAAFKTGGGAAAGQIGTAMTTAGNAAGVGMGGQVVGVIAAAGVGFAIGSAITTALEAYDNRAHSETVGDKSQDTKTEYDTSSPGALLQSVIEGGKQKFVTYGKDERGNTVAKESDYRTLNPNGGGGIGGMLAGIGNRIAAANAPLPGTTLDQVNVTGKKGGTPERSGADAALLAQMLASRTLRVEVTNPEQIRSGPGAAGGSPVPGNVPRS